MKSFIQVTAVLFLATNFGQAFFLSDLTEASQKAIQCFNSNVVGQYRLHTCFDNVKVESCLLEIVSADESDKKEIEKHLRNTRQELHDCPGFLGTKRCRHSEAYQCKERLNGKLTIGDVSVCRELQEVRDCLWSKLNDSCSDEVVFGELSEVEAVDRDCKTGNFNGGPCSADSINACVMKVYLDDNMTEENNFKCNETLVADAELCLISLQTECKTDYSRKLISNQLNLLNVNCENKNK